MLVCLYMHTYTSDITPYPLQKILATGLHTLVLKRLWPYLQTVVIAESRRHGTREGVDVTIMTTSTRMTTNGQFIKAFTQSLYSWNELALSNKQNAHYSLLYSFKQ